MCSNAREDEERRPVFEDETNWNLRPSRSEEARAPPHRLTYPADHVGHQRKRDGLMHSEPYGYKSGYEGVFDDEEFERLAALHLLCAQTSMNPERDEEYDPHLAPIIATYDYR